MRPDQTRPDHVLEHARDSKQKPATWKSLIQIQLIYLISRIQKFVLIVEG